jgi:hypothetical protein
MPTSTLLQLVARGRQDTLLTDNPQFTFFKQVYRRYTPFAIESIPIPLDGTPDFGRRISCVVPRKAELLSSLFLEVDLPQIPEGPDGEQYFWVNDIGHALIEDVSIEIGEKEIDKHLGAWMQIWTELTTPAEKREALNQMIGHVNDYPPPAPTAQRLVIPLRFWFCSNIGLAIPLIALQAHPVRLIFHLRRFQDLWWSPTIHLNPTPTPGPCPQIPPVAPARLQLYGDYVFLDTAERRRFASAEHDYLITQLQYTPPQSIPANVGNANVELHFNHACKEFIWVIQQDRIAQGAHEWFNYSNRIAAAGGDPSIPLADPMDSAVIRLDGYERFERRNAPYFRLVQPYQRHTVVPTAPTDFLYLYSFSLHPEDDQPAGSINCSMLDSIILSMSFGTENCTNTPYDRTVQVFAPNYNVLRIVGGLGGLAFIA